MTQWFTSPETTPRATCPNEIFVRFVQRNYANKVQAYFLDIGSGSGANSRYLKNQGFVVVAIDSAPEADANFHESVESYFSRPTTLYDCIFDINTLCHVEDPPYDAIYKALKPGGKFFSIHPADDTQADFKGKGYTRIADAPKMRQLLDRGFSVFTVRKSSYPDGDKNITSWVIEADK